MTDLLYLLHYSLPFTFNVIFKNVCSYHFSTVNALMASHLKIKPKLSTIIYKVLQDLFPTHSQAPDFLSVPKTHQQDLPHYFLYSEHSRFALGMILVFLIFVFLNVTSWIKFTKIPLVALYHNHAVFLQNLYFN